MPRIVTLLAQTVHNHWVDVFGGSGAGILGKPPSRMETFNDRDKHIFNLFNVLQDDHLRRKLGRLLSYTPFRSFNHYKMALDLVQHPTDDPVRNAWAFLVVSHQGMCIAHPALQRPTHFSRLVRPYSAESWLNLPDNLDKAARRFRPIQVLDDPWEKVITTFDAPRTAFFFDPPYFPDTVTRKFYPWEMTAEEHDAFLKRLQDIDGFAIVCGYDSPLYSERLHKWRHLTYPTHERLTIQGIRNPREESVWLNYDENGRRLL
jgi:DNA adenine methylase